MSVSSGLFILKGGKGGKRLGGAARVGVPSPRVDFQTTIRGKKRDGSTKGGTRSSFGMDDRGGIYEVNAPREERWIIIIDRCRTTE